MIQFLTLVAPLLAQNDIQRQNGIDASRLDSQKSNNKAGDSCTSITCAGNLLGQCVNGKIVTSACGSGLICAVLPLVNSRGTSVTCTTEQDRDRRFVASGVGSPEIKSPQITSLGKNAPSPTIIPPSNAPSSSQTSNAPSQTNVNTSQTPGAPNTFECIDDTKFKLFTGGGKFTIGSCPAGFCATRNPPNKNPCVGKANADRIDKKV